MRYYVPYACVSHIGKKRKTNEDNFILEKVYMEEENQGSDGILTGTIEPDSCPALLGVFDGMGGEEHGETAAWLAAKHMASFKLNSRDVDLERICRRVNRRLSQFAYDNSIISAGTTANLLLFERNALTGANLGDSRTYRITSSKMTQISVDDSAPGMKGGKGPLIQYLGASAEEIKVEPHIVDCPLEDGDVYLLCTDGLTDMVPENAIESIVRDHLNKTKTDVKPLEKAVQALLDEALNAGGRDNITIILSQVRVLKRGLFGWFGRN